MPRLAQNEKQREIVRRRILGAAQEILESEGIDAVSMRALGARVGLTASALYAYFPAKLDLLRALWWNALDVLYGRMEVISERERDPVKAIGALAQTYVEFGLENPVRFRALFMLDTRLKETGTHASYELLRRRVSEAMDQGRLQLFDADLGAQMIWAAVHGVVVLTDAAASISFESPLLLAVLMIKALLEGLAVG